MSLTRESILAAVDLPREKVQVPEWGGFLYVRTMTGHERDSFELSLIGSDKKITRDNIRARLVALTVTDEAGALLFTERDIQALGAKSAKALDRIFSKAQKLNGVSADDISEIEKNSGTGQSAGSTSASPSPSA